MNESEEVMQGALEKIAAMKVGIEGLIPDFSISPLALAETMGEEAMRLRLCILYAELALQALAELRKNAN